MFDEQRVASRLLALPDGERRLTNTLHLAELLQAGPVAEGLGMAGTLKWLATRRETASSSSRAEDDAQELRLESDQNLVNIVTVHRTKGLEYPVVFLPFLWDPREPRSAPRWAAWHDPADQHRQGLDLGSERFADAVAANAHERLAESLQKRLGRSVRLHVTLDESLLGGAVVKAGDLVIDGSVRTRLSQLAQSIMS